MAALSFFRPPSYSHHPWRATAWKAILERVDFARGRVRPNFSLDLFLGVGLWQRDHRSLRLQVDVLNATDRLNLINFSGLFSGTALAPSRTIGARLRMVL